MKKINGSITAPFTPMYKDGSVNYERIDDYAEFVVRNEIDGVFICGSSGEGVLLTKAERKAVAEQWIKASTGRFKVIVHTGGTCLNEQTELAVHAREAGAFAVASMAPGFLPPRRVEELVAYCKTVADAVPDMPFYYYHIPLLNNVTLSVVDLLKGADKEIPNFAGVKYTYDNLYEFDQCKYVAGGKFEMLHGLDETYLSALAFGYKGGVGGTYNHIFGVYKQMAEAFDNGNFELARELQHKSHLFINILGKFRGNIVVGKHVMKFMGIDCGPNRLPMQTITTEESELVKKELEAIDFFSFCNK
jgi:N-acetylneuraminate lyase